MQVRGRRLTRGFVVVAGIVAGLAVSAIVVLLGIVGLAWFFGESDTERVGKDVRGSLRDVGSGGEVRSCRQAAKLRRGTIYRCTLIAERYERSYLFVLTAGSGIEYVRPYKISTHALRRPCAHPSDRRLNLRRQCVKLGART